MLSSSSCSVRPSSSISLSSVSTTREQQFPSGNAKKCLRVSNKISSPTIEVVPARVKKILFCPTGEHPSLEFRHPVLHVHTIMSEKKSGKSSAGPSPVDERTTEE